LLTGAYLLMGAYLLTGACLLMGAYLLTGAKLALCCLWLSTYFW
jgi:hypothetical protein